MRSRLIPLALVGFLIGGIAVTATGATSATEHKSSDHSPSDDLHHAMTKGMESMKSTGNVDKDFVTMMIRHHQNGIEMAEVEMEHGTNDQVKALAKKMIDEQRKEIDELKKHQ